MKAAGAFIGRPRPKQRNTMHTVKGGVIFEQFRDLQILDPEPQDRPDALGNCHNYGKCKTCNC
jgi:hypothetical protein